MKFKCNKKIKELMELYAKPSEEPEIKAVGIVSFKGHDHLTMYTKACMIMRKVPECSDIDFIVNDEFVGTVTRIGDNMITYRKHKDTAS